MILQAIMLIGLSGWIPLWMWALLRDGHGWLRATLYILPMVVIQFAPAPHTYRGFNYAARVIGAMVWVCAMTRGPRNNNGKKRKGKGWLGSALTTVQQATLQRQIAEAQ